MPLESKKKTIIYVDHDKLEDFIKEVYGQQFDFVADQESNNDSAQEFYVESKELGYQAEQIANFKATGDHIYLTRDLLTDLCNRGLIESGDYVVSVSW